MKLITAPSVQEYPKRMPLARRKGRCYEKQLPGTKMIL